MVVSGRSVAAEAKAAMVLEMMFTPARLVVEGTEPRTGYKFRICRHGSVYSFFITVSEGDMQFGPYKNQSEALKSLFEVAEKLDGREPN